MKYYVSGLPRSGTTWMMRCLEAGGMDCYAETDRYELKSSSANNFNPEDHHEEVVKAFCDMLLHYNDLSESRIIIMRRDLNKLEDSQLRVLKATHRVVHDKTYYDYLWECGITFEQQGAICWICDLDLYGHDPFRFFDMLQAQGWPLDPKMASMISHTSLWRGNEHVLRQYQ